MFDMSEVLRRIKEEKKKNQLTNKELSEQTGISLGTLNKILSGDSKDPQISAVIKIAIALNVSADYLIFGSDVTKLSQDKLVATNPLDNDESNALTLYRHLDRDDRSEIRGMMKHMLTAEKYKQDVAKMA